MGSIVSGTFGIGIATIAASLIATTAARSTTPRASSTRQDLVDIRHWNQQPAMIFHFQQHLASQDFLSHHPAASFGRNDLRSDRRQLALQIFVGVELIA